MTRSQSSSVILNSRLSRGDAGVVDQDVEPAELLDHAGDGGLDGGGVADVARRCRRPGPRRAPAAVALAASSSRSSTATEAPSAANRFAVAGADAARRSGDDGDPSVVAAHGCGSPRFRSSGRGHSRAGRAAPECGRVSRGCAGWRAVSSWIVGVHREGSGSRCCCRLPCRRRPSLVASILRPPGARPGRRRGRSRPTSGCPLILLLAFLADVVPRTAVARPRAGAGSPASSSRSCRERWRCDARAVRARRAGRAGTSPTPRSGTSRATCPSSTATCGTAARALRPPAVARARARRGAAPPLRHRLGGASSSRSSTSPGSCSSRSRWSWRWCGRATRPAAPGTSPPSPSTGCSASRPTSRSRRSARSTPRPETSPGCRTPTSPACSESMIGPSVTVVLGDPFATTPCRPSPRSRRCTSASCVTICLMAELLGLHAALRVVAVGVPRADRARDGLPRLALLRRHPRRRRARCRRGVDRRPGTGNHARPARWCTDGGRGPRASRASMAVAAPQPARRSPRRSAASAYFVRGQKNRAARRPSCAARRAGAGAATDWLTVLFIATNEPWAPRRRTTPTRGAAPPRGTGRAARGQVGQGLHVGARHQERVPLEHRPHVEEAATMLGLEDDLGRDLARGDRAERQLGRRAGAYRRATTAGRRTYASCTRTDEDPMTDSIWTRR